MDSILPSAEKGRWQKVLQSYVCPDPVRAAKAPALVRPFFSEYLQPSSASVRCPACRKKVTVESGDTRAVCCNPSCKTTWCSNCLEVPYTLKRARDFCHPANIDGTVYVHICKTADPECVCPLCGAVMKRGEGACRSCTRRRR